MHMSMRPGFYPLQKHSFIHNANYMKE
jgi:hypothetical protein